MSLLELIQKTYPDVGLIFSNIGIVGNALPTGWEKSVPMKLIDLKKSIWTIDITLTDGFVKFRNARNFRIIDP